MTALKDPVISSQLVNIAPTLSIPTYPYEGTYLTTPYYHNRLAASGNLAAGASATLIPADALSCYCVGKVLLAADVAAYLQLVFGTVIAAGFRLSGPVTLPIDWSPYGISAAPNTAVKLQNSGGAAVNYDITILYAILDIQI